MANTTARTIKDATDSVEELATAVREQATEIIRQGYEVVTIAKDQTIASIKQSQQYALDALAKWNEVTAKMTPKGTGIPAPEFAKTFDAGFEVATELLAAQRKFATSLFETLVPVAV